MKNEKILSVLIDESGDFGRVDQHDPYYHVVMVLHEQNKSISLRKREEPQNLSCYLLRAYLAVTFQHILQSAFFHMIILLKVILKMQLQQYHILKI